MIEPTKKWGKIKAFLRFAVFCFILGVLLAVGLIAYYAKDLPDPSKIENRQIIQSTKILDRTGEITLYDIHGEENRTVISYEDIPQYVKDATLVAEDDNFYHHIGFDWKGIVRAFWSNITNQRISQGASTITQQFIKNAYLGGPQSERTYGRKIKEVILALAMERKYSKDEILGFYLNQVPYGSNAYGIEAASWTFFNKPAKELTLAESSLLAALPQGPSLYSPYGSHPDLLQARWHWVLDRMVKFGYITQEQADEAKLEEFAFASREDLKAHHFVTMIQEYLEAKYSRIYTDINMAGLRVYTTLDWELQQAAEIIVSEQAVKNQANYRASNAALVAIDPKSGQVLSLVGSKNYSEDQFNVATSPFRQPGSSFKPFAYAKAFENGYRPETIIFDLPTSFGKFGPGAGTEYRPNNYDSKFRGPLSMRQALAQSINIPAVKTLYLAGIEETIKLAQDMGITTLKDRNSFGLSLVLGGGEVKLIDETAAYGVFATDGVKHPMTFILKIEDSQGNVLEEFQDNPVQVLEANAAKQINSILSDEAARAPMFGNGSKLYLPDRPAAAKTGTTQDYSDGWAVGYTPSLVVGAWAGNNDYGDKMKPGAAGIYVAAPIWNNFMKQAYELKTKNKEERKNLKDNEFFLQDSVEYFTAPDPLPAIDKPMVGGSLAYSQRVKINKLTGELATNETPLELIEERFYQQVHNILYYVHKEDPLGDYPSNPSDDEQFQNWEAPVLAWTQLQPCTSATCYNQSPPAASGGSSDNSNVNLSVVINSPQNNSSLSINQTSLMITADTVSSKSIKQLDFYFNNQLIGSDSTHPYSITFDFGNYLLPQKNQSIKVRAYDVNLNKAEDQINIISNF